MLAGVSWFPEQRPIEHNRWLAAWKGKRKPSVGGWVCQLIGSVPSGRRSKATIASNGREGLRDTKTMTHFNRRLRGSPSRCSQEQRFLSLPQGWRPLSASPGRVSLQALSPSEGA